MYLTSSLTILICSGYKGVQGVSLVGRRRPQGIDRRRSCIKARIKSFLRDVKQAQLVQDPALGISRNFQLIIIVNRNVLIPFMDFILFEAFVKGRN